MARRRGRFSERILEKAPRTGRKKISKKKTPKVSLPEIINIPGIGEIELPKQKRKTKAKKADAKPDIGRPKKVKGGKKRPPKVRITEAKPKVREPFPKLKKPKFKEGLNYLEFFKTSLPKDAVTESNKDIANNIKRMYNAMFK